MSSRPVSRLLTRAFSTTPLSGSVTDRELLSRFVRDKDESAFAAIVKRHGSLVLSVCRRVLGNPTDAEDACQASFLLLAQNAPSNRWGESVAAWLYATARQVALNALTSRNRRVKHEKKARMKPPANPLAEISGEELLSILDEELNHLPERYRSPLVLCCLEGLTRDEASQQLGIPIITLKSQIERGRQRLHDALSRRGVALGSGLLALLATSSAAAISPRLKESIIASASVAAPPHIAALTRGFVMTGRKFTVAAMSTIGFGLLVFAAGLGRVPAGDSQLPAPRVEPREPRFSSNLSPTPIQTAMACPTFRSFTSTEPTRTRRIPLERGFPMGIGNSGGSSPTVSAL